MSLCTVCSDPCLGSGQRNGSEQKWSGLTERVTLRVRVELLVYFLSHAQKSECKSLWLRRDAARPAIVIHTFTHSESGRWASGSWDLERVREKEREVKPEAPCWGVHLGMKRRSDLFRCEEGCVASPSHTHTHTHTHTHADTWYFLCSHIPACLISHGQYLAKTSMHWLALLRRMYL